MTQEEKELVLRDLCARLMCGVKIYLKDDEYGELVGILYGVYPTEERIIVDELNKPVAPINVRCGGFRFDKWIIKPYLRPMSSMTEEEKETHECFFNEDGLINCSVYVYVDWLLEHHFDYRGLITMGLALEAQEGMYNFNKQN